MNLSRLERMSGDGDLSREAFQYLLNCRAECEWLDYKEALHLENDAQLCAFTKDVLAIKNVGGGYIVVGVKDKTWEQIGIAQTLPYDSKQLRDKVMKASGVDVDLTLVHHSLHSNEGVSQFALIHVRASKKRSKRRSPKVVEKDFCRGTGHGLSRGEIYVRKGDSTVRIASQAELEELLERIEDQADEDAVQPDAARSPFAIEVGTYRLLERGFERFVGRDDLRVRLEKAILGDPRIWIVNVHGPGGVGKSALVNWIAHKLYDSRAFEAILQLTAKETVLTDGGIVQSSRSLYSLENLLDHLLLLFQDDPTGDLDSKRSRVIEMLSAWKTLIILDNMETVSDGRILNFIQSLPPESQAKVVLTSRTKSGGWELPIPVTEMNHGETRDFLQIRSEDMGVHFPLDDQSVKLVQEAGGGLPLATQWIIGQYRKTKHLPKVVGQAIGKDSPVLEFSFRNIWNLVSSEARTVLALLSIFDGPVTPQDIVVASEMARERVDAALEELQEVTLVNAMPMGDDGSQRYSALPITLSFARNELAQMGELGSKARQRVSRYSALTELQEHELARFRGDFQRYGIESPTERRAAILTRRAEADLFAGNHEGAEVLFAQARDLAPHSPYILARYAVFELSRGKTAAARQLADEACSRCNRLTGAFCYAVKARVLDAQRDRTGRIAALEKALTYDSDDPVLRHQYGVALSRAGREREAVEEFTKIIQREELRDVPRETLMMALSTRVLNLRRLKRNEEAAADIERARELAEKYPFLAQAARGLFDTDIS